MKMVTNNSFLRYMKKKNTTQFFTLFPIIRKKKLQLILA